MQAGDVPWGGTFLAYARGHQSKPRSHAVNQPSIFVCKRAKGIVDSPGQADVTASTTQLSCLLAGAGAGAAKIYLHVRVRVPGIIFVIRHLDRPGSVRFGLVRYGSLWHSVAPSSSLMLEYTDNRLLLYEGKI